MKVTAITRFKHGEIFERLKRLGWTQSDLARKAGLSVSTTNNIINLIRRPTIEQATAIQKAFGEAGDYFDVLAEWPETFAGLKRGYKREQTAEVEMENLLSCREAMMIPAPEVDIEARELDDSLESILDELTENQATVIRMRYWGNFTTAQVAKKIGLCEGSVYQIQGSAMRKMRKHERIQKLLEHLPWDLTADDLGRRGIIN